MTRGHGPGRATTAAIGLACLLGAFSAPTFMPEARARAATLSQTRTDYLLDCAGCHGETGRSDAALVPDLQDQVGYFLCTPQGRAYVERLPNVAFAALPSDRLAALLNFVVTRFGGSAPATLPFTTADIALMRRAPSQMADFMGYRARVVAGVVKACPAAATHPAFSGTDPYATSNAP